VRPSATRSWIMTRGSGGGAGCCASAPSDSVNATQTARSRPRQNRSSTSIHRSTAPHMPVRTGIPRLVREAIRPCLSTGFADRSFPRSPSFSGSVQPCRTLGTAEARREARIRKRGRFSRLPRMERGGDVLVAIPELFPGRRGHRRPETIPKRGILWMRLRRPTVFPVYISRDAVTLAGTVL
jgi:hypothetical protein